MIQTIAEDRTWFYLLRSSAITITKGVIKDIKSKNLGNFTFAYKLRNIETIEIIYFRKNEISKNWLKGKEIRDWLQIKRKPWINGAMIDRSNPRSLLRRLR